jgi:hypothetical protein
MKKTKVYNTTRTYLGKGVLGVEIVSGQVRNCMILGKLGKSTDPLVDILLLNQIFRDSRRNYQSRNSSKAWKDDAAGVEPDVA